MVSTDFYEHCSLNEPNQTHKLLQPKTNLAYCFQIIRFNNVKVYLETRDTLTSKYFNREWRTGANVIEQLESWKFRLKSKLKKYFENNLIKKYFNQNWINTLNFNLQNFLNWIKQIRKTRKEICTFIWSEFDWGAGEMIHSH